MTRTEDDRLDLPEDPAPPAPRRKDPHPSEIIPGVFGRRLGIEGVPRHQVDRPAAPGDDETPPPVKPVSGR